MIVLGITGRAQHGKDTAGRVLVERFGFKRYAFADQLKEMALRVDPILTFDPEDGRPFSLSQLVGETGWESAKQWSEVRRFLQELGTSVRDIVGRDSWVRALGVEVFADGPPQRVVITDVRFPNEVDYIRNQLGGWVLRVVRPDFDNGVADHPSEAWVPRLSVDHEIENRDLDDFQLEVAAFVDDIVLGPEETWVPRES